MGLDSAHAPNLFEETGMSVEAGVSLENDEDDVRGPANESQHHAAAQEEPVVVVVVHQALQCMRDQGLALSDLGAEQAEGEKNPSVLQVAVILFQILYTRTPIPQLSLQNEHGPLRF